MVKRTRSGRVIRESHSAQSTQTLPEASRVTATRSDEHIQTIDNDGILANSENTTTEAEAEGTVEPQITSSSEPDLTTCTTISDSDEEITEVFTVMLQSTSYLEDDNASEGTVRTDGDDTETEEYVASQTLVGMSQGNPHYQDWSGYRPRQFLQPVAGSTSDNQLVDSHRRPQHSDSLSLQDGGCPEGGNLSTNNATNEDGYQSNSTRLDEPVHSRRPSTLPTSTGYPYLGTFSTRPP